MSSRRRAGGLWGSVWGSAAYSPCACAPQVSLAWFRAGALLACHLRLAYVCPLPPRSLA